MKLLNFFFLSRDDRIRTYGILLPKQARYQAALHPVVTIYVTTQSAKYTKLFFILKFHCKNPLQSKGQSLFK